MSAEGLKNVPRSGESASQAPSAERATGVIPSEWLVRLLEATHDARPNRTNVEAVEQVLTAAGGALEDVALGVSFVGDNGERTIVRYPSPRSSQVIGADDVRLFPDVEVERIIPIIIDEEGATLHAAVSEEERLTGGGPLSLFLDRLAYSLRAVLMNGRVHAQARAQAWRLTVLEERIIQSEKLVSLGQLTAGIVHELNNPLTTIVAYSDYLTRKLGSLTTGALDPADLRRVQQIHEAAGRILRFSRDLTAYARPSADAPTSLDIHDIIERALFFCEHELDKIGVSVERSFGVVPRVRGVEGQLTQVFVNLFTNAAHAMRDGGGVLGVTTSTDGRRVEIAVRDEGLGIREDLIPRIFEPFFTTKQDGTGLGLAIVHGILTRHSGSIRAAASSPRGMVFIIELPSAEHAPTSPPSGAG